MVHGGQSQPAQRAAARESSDRSAIELTIATCFVIAQFGVSFLMYCSARAMHETFGFSATASGSSIGFSLLLSFAPIYLAYAILVATWRWIRGNAVDGSWFVMILLLFFCILGCVGGEVWMLLDEWRFRSEVTSPSVPMWRARAWPNGSSSLLYSPTRGFWAGT